MFDFDEINLKSIETWVKIINIPRFPTLHIVDSVSTCFLLRKYVKFHHPLISLVFTLLLTTFTENFFHILHSRKMAVFEHPYLAIFTFAVWVLFNFSPLDVVFHISKLISPIIYLFSGFIIGRDLTVGIDFAVDFFPTNTVLIIGFGIFVVLSKYLLISFYGKFIYHPFPSLMPIIFEIIIGASIYYWLTDLGHFSNSLWFDKEEMRLVVVSITSILNLIFSFFSNSFFEKIYNIFGYILFSLIPYQGNNNNDEDDKINTGEKKDIKIENKELNNNEKIENSNKTPVNETKKENPKSSQNNKLKKH